MLPREYLRENAARLLQEMPERFGGAGLETYTELDRERREAVTLLEEKRRRRNELTSVRGKPSPEALEEMKALKEEIRGLEQRVEDADGMLAAVEKQVPNVPQDSVPRGADETANRVERQWGKPRKFDFEPQAHWDLGPALGILDFERGAKIAGARFTRPLGSGSAPFPRPHQLLPRRARRGARLPRAAAALPRQRRLALRDGTAAEVRGRLSSRRARATTSSRRPRCPSRTSTATRS